MSKRRSLITLVERALPALRKALASGAIEVSALPGAVAVVEVIFPDSDRLPVYVTDAGEQRLCISYLWRECDIRPERRTELMETLLELNPSVPLSAFGRLGEHYVLIGALGPAATPADLALELATLADNGRDALAMLAEYLR